MNPNPYAPAGALAERDIKPGLEIIVHHVPLDGFGPAPAPPTRYTVLSKPYPVVIDGERVLAVNTAYCDGTSTVVVTALHTLGLLPDPRGHWAECYPLRTHEESVLPWEDDKRPRR